MPSPASIAATLRELRGLAETNLYDFRRSPRLAAQYAACLRRGCFRYVDDWSTCGELDCWSSMLSLRDRYGHKGPILADCEDLASAHAAHLALEGQPAMVGIRPGRRISHAVCGVLMKDGRGVAMLDPSVWAGMPPLSDYSGIWWEPVRVDVVDAQIGGQAAAAKAA